MAISPRKLRIGGATLAAVLLVAGAYVLPGLSAPELKTVNAELTDDILAAYVAKDSDADGLPDWQESLYGTDPQKADTDGDGITDGEAVRRGLLTPTALASQIPENPIGEEDIPGEAPAPGSFTDQFARAFFEAYITASNGQPMSAEAQQEIVTRLLARFQADAAKTLVSSYSLVSVRTGNFVNITQYAGQVEQVLESAIPDSPDSDIALLSQRLIEDDDQSAAARLNELSVQYSEAVSRLLEVPAPSSARESHLMLIRSLDQTRRAAIAVQDYKQDPILTMGAIMALNQSLSGTVDALSGIAEQILLESEPVPGSSGYLIVDMVRRTQTQ